ncbi:TPA: hypothetical protein QC443_005841 [Bacillus cereus]|uniref:hypothetical protein n=1 Tax=Bacillus cereus group TaxID=86661 RepID=UPI001926A668|nr:MULTISPECIES: hypothetical protein [Bacillus cereus group]MBL3878793.1 hypothetical protein [Bacillus cereus]MCQ6533055.1 hypothetical protein [Bacillus mycoides]QWI54171.1 hypothetical protein EXW42_08450 [Bacillus mycoides]QWI90791.1 hypothetical protein J5W00_04735 [Bacillus mycoides]BCD03838.1 hypothetical protein BC30052_0893 [Bacillus cereus]
MKQPQIKIFGQIYKVIQIEFNKKNGQIEKIIYQLNDHQNRTVFRGVEMISSSLTYTNKIQDPTPHPFHNYAYAPNLESLLVQTIHE